MEDQGSSGQRSSSTGFIHQLVFAFEKIRCAALFSWWPPSLFFLSRGSTGYEDVYTILPDFEFEAGTRSIFCKTRRGVFKDMETAASKLHCCGNKSINLQGQYTSHTFSVWDWKIQVSPKVSGIYIRWRY